MLVGVLKWLADTQAFMALMAIGMYGWSCLDLGVVPEPVYAWTLFWSTLGFYQAHDLIQSKQPLRLLLPFVLPVGIGLRFIPYNEVKLVVLGIAGVIAGGYVYPFLNHGRSLRSFGWLKAIWVSLVWCLTTQGIILFDHAHPDWLLWWSRFFWILGLSILFDYRDQEKDVQMGMRTWGNYFSLKEIKIIQTILYVLAVVLEKNRLTIPGFSSWPFIIALILSLMVTWVKLKPQMSPYFYTLLLDSCIIWPGVLSLLFWIIA